MNESMDLIYNRTEQKYINETTQAYDFGKKLSLE